MRFYNVTSHYAKTRDWKFQVVKPDGKPAEGAKISIQLMNMAEHSQIAELMTDADGMAQIQLGLSDMKFIRSDVSIIHRHNIRIALHGECQLIRARIEIIYPLDTRNTLYLVDARIAEIEIADR